MFNIPGGVREDRPGRLREETLQVVLPDAAGAYQGEIV